MATVMEFTMPADALPLGAVFGALPEVTVELERLVPNETPVVPYVWVRGAAAEDVTESFEAFGDGVSVELVDHVDGESLLRAKWDEGFGVLDALAASNVVALSAVGRQGGWTFEVRGESHDAVSNFQERCDARDIPISITAVHALHSAQGNNHELTQTQREALRLAYERGYFDSPRRASLDEIANELGITQQSLSSRLRRGHRRLIAENLITD